jgi:hypothetical protein
LQLTATGVPPRLRSHRPREAERELDAATTRTALDAAAKKFMRAKAELKRRKAGYSA